MGFTGESPQIVWWNPDVDTKIPQTSTSADNGQSDITNSRPHGILDPHIWTTNPLGQVCTSISCRNNRRIFRFTLWKSWRDWEPGWEREPGKAWRQWNICVSPFIYFWSLLLICVSLKETDCRCADGMATKLAIHTWGVRFDTRIMMRGKFNDEIVYFQLCTIHTLWI